jgi:hypothetical protein
MPNWTHEGYEMNGDAKEMLNAFSQSYAEARRKFLAAAGEAGLEVTSYRHPLHGVGTEELALDVALDGAPDADKLLIVSSGCHGVEGYCGSGVQVFALGNPEFRAQCAAKGVAVLYLHAINPYGFSHTRRVTHENVDLNRNFQDFSKPLPGNAAYKELHPVLLPNTWPPGVTNQLHIAWLMATKGMKWLQTAVSGGQYDMPDGLFYGGTQPTWSNKTVRHVLGAHAGRARHLAWIDLHTGLGPTGHGERGFVGGGGDAEALSRASDWWGGNGATPVILVGGETSVSAQLVGLMASAANDECPHAEITNLAIEFGTVPLLQVMKALRAEQWLVTHPDAPKEQAAQIKRELRDAFYVDTPQWKQQVVQQAMQALQQGVDGLGRAASRG